MLLLVFPDRNVRSAVEKDIGSLEDRIIEKRNRLAFTVFPGLVLPLSHAIEPAHAGGAIEYPAQLGVRRYGTLCKQDRSLRIDSARDQRSRHFAYARPPLGGVHGLGPR